MKVRLLTVALGLLVSPLSWGEFYSGHKVAEWAAEVDRYNSGVPGSSQFVEFLFLGYVAGIYDALELAAETEEVPHVICFPRGVTTDQAGKIVSNYIKQNPSKLHHPGSRVVALALNDAFPCP
ncbi:MAG TPA: hypothetical protein DDZ92_07155 [Halomonas sp.]|nr:hypothetical protein [Halomonas sp.]|tara:strand:+ start:1718 stop:2086 length:369 start_codon:yes stop_codon:yes gene_type:complete